MTAELLREFIGVGLPYIAVAVFVLGLAWRAMRWALAPRHLKWTLYPPPKGLPGQLVFMAKEIVVFRALLKNSRALWLGAWLFHVAMAMMGLWFAAFLLGCPSRLLPKVGGLLLAGSALYLVAYRLLDRKMRAVSSPVEFFNLAIFVAIIATGAALVYVQGADIAAIREYFVSLATFRPGAEEVPRESMFLVTLLLTEFFLLYFPFTRMVHMVSKYFAFHSVNWEH